MTGAVCFWSFINALWRPTNDNRAPVWYTVLWFSDWITECLVYPALYVCRRSIDDIELFWRKQRPIQSIVLCSFHCTAEWLCYCYSKVCLILAMGLVRDWCPISFPCCAFFVSWLVAWLFFGKEMKLLVVRCNYSKSRTQMCTDRWLR